MNTYICTQGTSIGNVAGPALRELQRENLAWDAKPGKHDPLSEKVAAFSKQLDVKVKELCDSKTSEAELEKASAELKVLVKSHVAATDTVVILATDTLLGRHCADALKTVIVKRLGLAAPNVRIYRIEGLQVSDAKQLQGVGFGNFIDTARREIETALAESDGSVYLCPNGGFKGVVPFLTVLGMRYHCRVLYTFELADALIALPTMPFTLDTELYGRATRALELLSEAVEQPKQVYLNNVDNYDPREESLFLGFVQVLPGDKVTPAPLLEKLLDASAKRGAMLSDDARRDLEKCDVALFTEIILSSQDNAWLYSPGHFHNTLHNTDLVAIKPGHANCRLLGYVHEGRFYVARAVNHDAYDRIINDHKAPKVKDYPPEKFTFWTPPSDDVHTEQERTVFDSQKQRITHLEAETENLANEVLDAESRMEKMQTEADAHAAQASAHAAEVASLNDALKKAQDAEKTATEQCNQLTQQLDAMKHRTFFQKLKACFVGD